MAKYILLISVFFWSCAWSAATQTVRTTNVFEQITAKDSVSGAKINFHQDRRIEQLFLDRQTISAGGEVRGFRVQVFSSNIQQTARREAFRVKELVERNFPDVGVYESFSSPFWRVRVGDFRTREDAEEFRTELRRAFPALQREMFITQDIINLR
jgi:hypothetical protein